MHPIVYPPGQWPGHYGALPFFAFPFLFLIWLLIIGVPLIRVLTKAGYSGWWVILAIIPLVNLISLWVFAFSRWPALRRSGD